MQPNLIQVEGPKEDTPNDFCCQSQVPVLAELLCSEPPIEDESEESLVPTEIKSYFDPNLLHHPQALSQLKLLESRNKKTYNYIGNSGKEEILPYMRKVVGSWMLEVCEEQSCEDNVFPLAIGLLDQFLGTTKIKAPQLQLVACVCLLLASKTRQESHFSLQLLSWYTENSVTLQNLMAWELLMLSQLNWDINVITPTDFVDYLLVRIPGMTESSKEFQLIRRHAIAFIALCCTEPRFVGISPSLVAASAIYTALKGIQKDSLELTTLLAQTAETCPENLIAHAASIEQVISAELVAIEQTIDTPMMKTQHPSSGSIHSQQPFMPLGPETQNKIVSNGSSCCHSSTSTSNSLTPTDVQDIVC